VLVEPVRDDDPEREKNECDEEPPRPEEDERPDEQGAAGDGAADIAAPGVAGAEQSLRGVSA
jgi:hypothetical protein